MRGGHTFHWLILHISDEISVHPMRPPHEPKFHVSLKSNPFRLKLLMKAPYAVSIFTNIYVY